jgi:hypothetical protein
MSDGSRTTYFYAWKGGPRLPGKPGDPALVAAHDEAVASKVDQPVGTIQSILNAYQATTKFAGLASRTRKDYVRNVKQIKAEYGEFPSKALSDRRCRDEFLTWCDRIAVKSRRQADYVCSTFAANLAWAFDRGLVPLNPCERPGCVSQANRNDIIWSEQAEAASGRSPRTAPAGLPPRGMDRATAGRPVSALRVGL